MPKKTKLQERVPDDKLMEHVKAAKVFINNTNAAYNEETRKDLELVAFMHLFHPDTTPEMLREMRDDLKKGY